LNIEEKKYGNIEVLYPSGRLDAYAANDVESKLNPLTEQQKLQLVFCMDKLEYISSSGLRVLLAALKKVRKQQGDIRLAGLQPYVKEVFDVAGFSQLFKIFEEEQKAVDSYKSEQ